MKSRQQDSDTAKPTAVGTPALHAAAFQPVLPQRGEAESPGAWGENGDGALSDEEWLREVPPHHG